MFFFPRDFHRRALELEKKINKLGSRRSKRVRAKRKTLWQNAGIIDLFSYAMQDMPIQSIALLFGEITPKQYWQAVRKKIKKVKKLKEEYANE